MAECPCADCDLPEGHEESPDPDDIEYTPIPPISSRRYRLVPIEDPDG